MATLIKDRSVLRHKPHYTVHLGSDRFGKVVGSLDKRSDGLWQVRLRNHMTKQMESDMLCGSFNEAKRYALEDAARWEQ